MEVVPGRQNGKTKINRNLGHLRGVGGNKAPVPAKMTSAAKREELIVDVVKGINDVHV